MYDKAILLNVDKANAQQFLNKMAEHMKDPETLRIGGTYRGDMLVIHYYNPKTEINIIKNTEGNYVSGWKLSKAQIKSLRESGNIQ